MAQVLRSPSHFPSPTSSASASSLQIPPCASPTHHDTHFLQCLTNSSTSPSHSVQVERELVEGQEQGTEEISGLELLVTVFRKSLVGGCSSNREWYSSAMEIGLPTDVRHVAHVTFDRFDGFLGLPDEFEPEVPRRPPSASTRVFGVSTQSMQLSFDSRGNSVPTILLMMQRRLYELGGLQAEGIFRINAENSQEEYVRDQLNRGVVPAVIDVHCLAGLIKAWFRELPSGVLDSLSPEQVMESQSEEECSQLVKLLPPTESALLNWAINLMADVAQLESLNKMNARNIAMVFAPNMTQMLDPLTALMYAVQVMNFLKTLIEKTMRERQEHVPVTSQLTIDPSDENGHQSFCIAPQNNVVNKKRPEQMFVSREPAIDTHLLSQDESSSAQNLLTSIENLRPGCEEFLEVSNQATNLRKGVALNDSGSAGQNEGSKPETLGTRATSQSSNPDLRRKPRKGTSRRKNRAGPTVEKSKGISLISSIDSSAERIEAWR